MTLTLRQTQVLAAIERTGKTNILHLTDQLPGWRSSDIWRVLEALARRGLVAAEGDPNWRYAGTPEHFTAAGYSRVPDFVPFRVWAVPGRDGAGA
jgi:hypothetical protein